MDVDSDSVNTEQELPPVTSHRRILWATAVVAVTGAIAGFIFVSQQFGLGVLLGGVISFVNYYWLKFSLKKIFDSVVADGEKPRFLALRYFSRYLTLGVILAIVFLSSVIPVIAVIFGLTSFALAIVIEGLIRAFSTLFQSRKL